MIRDLTNIFQDPTTQPSDLATTTQPSPDGGADESSPSAATMVHLSQHLDQKANQATADAKAFRHMVGQVKEAQQQCANLKPFVDAAKAAEADAVADAILAEQMELQLQQMGDELSKMGGELSKYKDLSKSLKESFDKARKNVRRLREERHGMIVAATDMFDNVAALRSTLAANDREITKLTKLTTTRQLTEEKLHKKVQSLERTLKNLSRS